MNIKGLDLEGLKRACANENRRVAVVRGDRFTTVTIRYRGEQGWAIFQPSINRWEMVTCGMFESSAALQEMLGCTFLEEDWALNFKGKWWD